MPAISVQFADPAFTWPGGVLTLNFQGGLSIGFEGGPSHLASWILSQLPEQNGVLAMGISHLLAQDPDVADPAVWDGKTVTLNLDEADPIDVFKVQ